METGRINLLLIKYFSIFTKILKIMRKGIYRGKINGKSTKEYRAWQAMKARCYCKCNETMGKYRLLNIKVCDRWLKSYPAFIDDMGVAPGPEYTLDRIDSTKDYSPDNCRWATWKTQSSNRGDFNISYTYNGETLILKQWAEKLGIKYTTLHKRLTRSKMSFEEAINYKYGKKTN